MEEARRAQQNTHIVEAEAASPILAIDGFVLRDVLKRPRVATATISAMEHGKPALRNEAARVQGSQARITVRPDRLRSGLFSFEEKLPAMLPVRRRRRPPTSRYGRMPQSRQ